MRFNKEIIIHLVLAIVMLGIAGRILLPLLYDFMKGKTLGLNKKGDDFDYLVKKQKELLKSQYNIIETNQKNENTNSKNQSSKSTHYNEIKKELSWGGTEYVKELQTKIKKDYSYQFGESKFSAFILLCDRRGYLQFLNAQSDKINRENIINFMSTCFIFFVMIDENKEKSLNFTENCAKKINCSPIELSLAIQLKILLHPNAIKIKEERIFSDQFVLGQYSDETLQKIISSIVSEEANLWAKSPSLFFEEMSLFLTYANLLSPIIRPKNKLDFEGALNSLNLDTNCSLEEIKKRYKKLAQIFHPDKIVPQKLPKSLETRAIQKFNIIQESFEILNSRK
jgi:hypothetical protein